MKHTIPQQVEGREMNASENLTFENNIAAKEFYKILYERLLNINEWHTLLPIPMTRFIHLNSAAVSTTIRPQEGDYVKIDIPGPGLPTTDGFDYVQIVRIDQSDQPDHQALTLTLRPCPSPTKSMDSEIQHFFQNIATSTLQIQRIGEFVTANYFGRNEVINIDVASLSDKIRNLIIGLGAKMGASFPQWKLLLKGLMQTSH